MALVQPGSLADRPEPLVETEIPDPRPGPGEVLLAVSACGVCHTDLDIVEGRAAPRRLPLVPGHQVVGRVLETGSDVSGLAAGDRVGVAWIASACGQCRFCALGLENLCPDFQATGLDRDGGYAERMVARAAFVYAIPPELSDVHAAPLLCAGAIGYRSLSLAGLSDGDPLGLTGFGASGHLVLQLARRRYPGSPVYVFARDPIEREFARSLGAAWTGPIGAAPPRPLRAIIDTTPVWTPVLEALAALEPGGRLVVNAIRKEARDREVLGTLDYPRHLWMEKEVKSVANVTRRDVRELLEAAAGGGIAPAVERYSLADANRALRALRAGGLRGAKVLVVNEPHPV
jgi:propanol-preferring alcohol dehydrogenase